MLKRMKTLTRDELPLRQLLRSVLQEVEQSGHYRLDSSPELALPRLFEVAEAVIRLRGLKVNQTQPNDA
jgi:hypothetical protein